MTRTVFLGGMVFDGTGAAPGVADVVAEDDRIVEVGPGLDGDHVVDCRGRGVLPGLFDCHVHLISSLLGTLERLEAPFSLQFYEAAENMRRTLAVGITTVRDAAGADLGIRVAQERGLIRGPRLRISVQMICQTGGHNDDWEPSGCAVPWWLPHPGRPEGIADGPDEARKKVRELIRAGADVIKIATTGGVFSPRDYPQHAHLRDVEIATIVEEATAAGIFVMAHAQGSAGIKSAVRNGVRSIEHGSFLDEEAISMMLERGTWLVPTRVAGEGISAAVEAGISLPAASVEKERMLAVAESDSLRAAIAAGVNIAMGSDAPVSPHGKNLRELELLVEHGMTAAQALHAATGSAARLIGLQDELGFLQPGKRADLVVVDGDLLNVTNLGNRVRAVYQDGALVSGTTA